MKLLHYNGKRLSASAKRLHMLNSFGFRLTRSQYEKRGKTFKKVTKLHWTDASL